MRYLGLMTGKEAIRLAKEESGLTEYQIATRLGVSISVVKRYLDKDDIYLPSLEMLPRLCVVLGNTLLLDWQEIRLEKEERLYEVDMQVVPLAATTIMETLSPFAKISESVKQSRYEDITEALDEVLFQCARIRSALRLGSSSSRKKKGGVFSCPLWSFWNRH